MRDDFSGKDWQEFELDDVQAFLDRADDEPLTWEAKGTTLDPHEVRKQVGGFANSHEGGYLILGASKPEDAWMLDGVEFPGDPAATVTDYVADGVRPIPEGLDVRSFALPDDRHVAVVKIPPTSTPPTIVRGTVYERLPGQTRPVKDVVRLAELFARGESARVRSQAASRRLLNDLNEQMGSIPDGTARIGTGYAAAGYAPDISSRLFAQSFREELFAAVETTLGFVVDQPPNGYRVTEFSHSQEAVFCQFDPMLTFPGGSGSWFVRADWGGAVAVITTRQIDVVTDTLVAASVIPSMKVAEAVGSLLSPGGDRYAHVAFLGSPFDAAVVNRVIRMDRGPLGIAAADDLKGGIERELKRALGDLAFEPEEP